MSCRGARPPRPLVCALFPSSAEGGMYIVRHNSPHAQGAQTLPWSICGALRGSSLLVRRPEDEARASAQMEWVEVRAAKRVRPLRRNDTCRWHCFQIMFFAKASYHVFAQGALTCSSEYLS